MIFVLTMETAIGIFKIAIRLLDWLAFMWKSKGILIVFYILTLKQVFWKTKTFLKKLESTKWTYYKERTFATESFIFLKIWFEYKNLFINSWFNIPKLPKYTYLYFSWALQFYWRVCFPV